ncbi:MAG TPA: hypothetical protein VJ838_08510 [Gaiellaceae bacterium]|nr:hypothetical protein [Gaiellaceae bacterium]
MEGALGADHLRLRRIFHDDERSAVRAARTLEDAIRELRRCAGHQFDPNVVDLLCEVLAVENEPAAKLAARG